MARASGRSREEVLPYRFKIPLRFRHPGLNLPVALIVSLCRNTDELRDGSGRNICHRLGGYFCGCLAHSPVWFETGLASDVRHSHWSCGCPGNSTSLVTFNGALRRDGWRMRCVVPACFMALCPLKAQGLIIRPVRTATPLPCAGCRSTAHAPPGAAGQMRPPTSFRVPAVAGGASVPTRRVRPVPLRPARGESRVARRGRWFVPAPCALRRRCVA